MILVSMTMPLTPATQRRLKEQLNSHFFFQPLPVRRSEAVFSTKKTSGDWRVEVQASLKTKAVKGLTAAALTASAVIPDIAEAAGPGLTPSLKNFLLSIVAAGAVLGVLLGAVIGVAKFDPVKRS
ncbi:hypothetical protein JCGZ_07614 [Jatropha curcas]|uniref:Ultraviolet-B-repressible protein n=1 Tax=Jatropha curcas TaxID=180498 RepID=A0A067KGA0_JATCU|nr:uncharacterized protein LOC105638096 [Jatropha curcas]KDP34043.1 hypothetical protein JCGZ_07614 [Jatropha curcas]